MALTILLRSTMIILQVAVKFEKHGARCPQLRHEYKIYRELQNAPGFAKVHYFGAQDSYNLMVMDLLCPSLEDQFNKCGRRFSLKTVLMVADQLPRGSANENLEPLFGQSI